LKRLTITILAELVIFLALIVQEPSLIKPRSVFEMSGVTVVSPGQAGWQLAKADKKEILFRKIEFSERSNFRGIAEDLIPLASEFFGGIRPSKTPAPSRGLPKGLNGR
jgi:hypothetical protein